MSDFYIKPSTSNPLAPFDAEIAPFEETNVPEEILSLDKGRLNTDLVKAYLREIGRIPLYTPDQEVSEAQKIQAYLKLRTICEQEAKNGDLILQKYQELLTIRNQLTANLGHCPSWQRWAKVLGIEVAELKDSLMTGKIQWANLTNFTVEELETIEKKGLQAKHDMIKANLRLVVSVAKKYQNRGLELLDLIQEGTIGLERAVEKFDPTKGYRFSTYAYWWIRQGMTRAIATSSRTIRLPVHITEKLNKIKKVQRELSQTKGRTASLEEIGQELNMSTSEIREMFQKVPLSISLDLKVGHEKDTELIDLLETNLETPETLLIREALQNDLHQMLAELTKREQNVIGLRFGLTDGKCHSLANIGRILDLSRERVRQIESKAMKKLRHPKYRTCIKDYLELMG